MAEVGNNLQPKGCISELCVDMNELSAIGGLKEHETER